MGYILFFSVPTLLKIQSHEWQINLFVIYYKWYMLTKKIFLLARCQMIRNQNNRRTFGFFNFIKVFLDR